MIWKICLLTAIVIGYTLYTSHQAVMDESKTKIGVQQLKEDGGASAREYREAHWMSNTTYSLGWIGILAFGALLFSGDISKMYKQLTTIALFVLICSTGCGRRPFEPNKLENVGSNEEAFLLPYTGDTATQTSSNNEEYLTKNLVYTKQVRIPQKWVQTGYETFGMPNGEWRDDAVLIKVDKSPVTREWTADQNSGTSDRNEAVWVMTSDQVEFSTGWTCTARISARDDAVKFLHNYPNGSLKGVMDGEIRAKLQAEFGMEVTDLPMDELRKQATPHIVKVADNVIKFFKERGINITNLGITGGFVYKDPTIMATMVRVFNAEQEKNVRIAEKNAQDEANKTIFAAAQGQANALLQTKEAEAKGIKMVADAKAYEIEKAKQDAATYLTLKTLELKRTELDKWDGKFPVYYMGNSSPNML